MPQLETSVGVIAYDERGEGPPLVMLPGGAHSRHDFDQLRDLVPDRFRTVALDWPSHGDSPAGTGPASAMAFADAAEVLVETLAPEGAVVLGNSVGGFSAARLSLRRPELVRGLVLVDAGGFMAPSPRVRAFCGLMSRPSFLRRIYPRFGARYMRLRTEADRRALAAAVATTRRDPGLQAVCDLWASFVAPEHDLRAEAGRVAAPTLVVWGRRDPVIPLRVGRWVASRVPGAELVVLDSGHVPHTTDPEGFAAALIPFADAAFAAAKGSAA
ncbi:MAG TPA: alpha/beta hydrolase [Solirubrobacterales bacterium]|nr:alpha/beta hydrolase [Solirubrobacterales bacterium]